MTMFNMASGKKCDNCNTIKLTSAETGTIGQHEPWIKIESMTVQKLNSSETVTISKKNFCCIYCLTAYIQSIQKKGESND